MTLKCIAAAKAEINQHLSIRTTTKHSKNQHIAITKLNN